MDPATDIPGAHLHEAGLACGPNFKWDLYGQGVAHLATGDRNQAAPEEAPILSKEIDLNSAAISGDGERLHAQGRDDTGHRAGCRDLDGCKRHTGPGVGENVGARVGGRNVRVTVGSRESAGLAVRLAESIAKAVR